MSNKKIDDLQSELAKVRGKFSEQVLKKLNTGNDDLSGVSSLEGKSGLFQAKKSNKVSPVIEEDDSSIESRAFKLGIEDATKGTPNKAESTSNGLPDDLDSDSGASYYKKGYTLGKTQNAFKANYPNAKGGKTRKHKNKHSKKTMKKKDSKTRKSKKLSKKTLKKKVKKSRK
jgi:hypothetical protein